MMRWLRVPPPPTFQEFMRDPEAAARQYAQGLRALILRGRLMALSSSVMLGLFTVVMLYAGLPITPLTWVLWAVGAFMQLRALWAIWRCERGIRETLDRLEREGIQND